MISRFVFRAVFLSSSKIARAAKTAQLNRSLTIRAVSPCISNTVSRQYSAKPAIEEMCVDYEHVKKATQNSNVLIVDVREPDEIKEHGKIPNSINIPLGNVSPTLSQMPEKEFQQIYQRPKPSEDTEIIFYCMIGKRSGMAQENAQKLGFTNVKNYLGSWNDWATKTKA